MIRPTYFVSFPRSGHHWIVDMLSLCFGHDLHYNDPYKEPEHRMELCPDTNLEKSHDFDMNLDQYKYQAIALCRRDIGAAMRSYHKMLCCNYELQIFAAEQQDYWVRFVAKWMRPVQFGEHRMTLWYEDVKANPVQALVSLTSFLSTEPVPISAIIDAVNVKIDWNTLGLVHQCPKTADEYVI